jgi:hypothetical protein
VADRKRQAARRRHFHRQNGKCYWCGCEMVLIEGRPKHAGPQPDNMCTLDHLRDRHHPERTAPNTGEQRYVAACHKCNWERGRQSHLSQPIELRRQWAHH